MGRDVSQSAPMSEHGVEHAELSMAGSAKPPRQMTKQSGNGHMLSYPMMAMMEPQVIHMARFQSGFSTLSPESQMLPGLAANSSTLKADEWRRTSTIAACKCCGAVGFYTKSCGKKHQCQIGKCMGGVPAWIRDNVGKSTTRPAPGTSSSLFRIYCPCCSRENRFELPRTGVLNLQCWECGNAITAKVFRKKKRDEPLQCKEVLSE